METKEAVIGLSFLLCFLFPAFIMHACGVFAHSWIRVEDDPCLAIGLLSKYNCCLSIREYKCVPFGSALDQRVVGLEVTAFVIMLFSWIGICFSPCFRPNHIISRNPCAQLGCFGIILYPVAAVFSFIGCVILVPTYHTTGFGYGFILCLTSSCMILLATLLVCGGMWYVSRNKNAAAFVNLENTDAPISDSSFRTNILGLVKKYSVEALVTWLQTERDT